MVDSSKIKTILIDLSGTLHVDDEPTPNAVVALEKLRNTLGITLRFVTNTTKESKQTLLNRLNRIGFVSISTNDLFTSLSAAAHYVSTNDLQPYYLLTEDAKNDFSNANDSRTENAVVVGLAPDKFNYENMNHAFKVLMQENATLIAVHEAKYYKRSDGLAIGPGCFARGLEYATGKKAVVIGKPNPYFFQCAVPDGVKPEECCMIGDDLNDDVCGAMNVGMKGILVKTGKYIENIESTATQAPTKVINSFSDAVDWLIEKKFKL